MEVSCYLFSSDIETFLNITLETNSVTLVNAIISALETFTDRYCNRTWANTALPEIAELALALLVEAIATQDVRLLWVQKDPDWESLRNDPRFQKIVSNHHHA